VPIINYTFIKTPRDVRQEPKPERGELRFEVFDESVWLMDANGEKISAAQTAGFLLDKHS
jgi:hypothetical protein